MSVTSATRTYAQHTREPTPIGDPVARFLHMANEQRLEQLKQKYQSVLNAIQQHQARLQNVHIENDKLLIRAEAPSEEAKNRIWDQIKTVDSSYSDLTADITVNTSLAPQQQAP